MARKLTARKVEQARPNPRKRIEIPDGGKPGLYLVIQSSGRKSWAVRYRFQGQARKLTLDGFPSLASAHRLAQEALDRVAEGYDPAADKQSAKFPHRAQLPLASAPDQCATFASDSQPKPSSRTVTILPPPPA